MAPTFAGTLDRDAIVRAVDAVVDLVSDPLVAESWERESALPGMTIGGLVRHLVSQPECAVEFLQAESPTGVEILSLIDYYARVDWLRAPIDAEANTSIRDDFNELAAAGPGASVAILQQARTDLPAALATAGPATSVPWQDCRLQVDDFLVCRLLEIVVHADDLAASLSRPTPHFDEAVLDPVVVLLATLSVRRHGQDALVRALARTGRARRPVSAF